MAQQGARPRSSSGTGSQGSPTSRGTKAVGANGSGEGDEICANERDSGEGKERLKDKRNRNERRKRAKAKKSASATPEALVSQAETLLAEGRPEDARPLVKKALTTLQALSDAVKVQVSLLPVLNLLATIELELGDADAARSYFLRAISLDPDGSIPDSEGGGAEKFLWLAQLSEEGGQDSVQWFEKGATVLRNRIAAAGYRALDLGNGHVDSGREKSEDLPADEMENMLARLASALCGIIEIYMTDLSLEPHAESTCSTLIQEALTVAPHSPEPHQTHASVLISKSQLPAARAALHTSMSLWKDLPPEESHRVPDFPTRISLCRLLMEVGMHQEALEVVERLVEEDDQSVEAWYLGGWCLYLLGHPESIDLHEDNGAVDQHIDEGMSNDKAEDGTGSKEKRTPSLISSREWLRQSLQLYEMQAYEDDRLRDHAVELIESLDQELGALGIEDNAEGEDAEWESDDEVEQGEEKANGELNADSGPHIATIVALDEDQEMQDT